MEPVFTLPYSEFCVAQRLRSLLPKSKGYSLLVPLSRQEKGIDLVLSQRQDRTRAVTIQVKSSRTYSSPPPARKTTRRFRYATWLNTFECPAEADFVCIVSLYPARDAEERKELATWWAPVILLFSQAEMREFLSGVKTVGGKPDRMFGFGFDRAGEVFQTRGDPERRCRDFSGNLLERRVPQLLAALRA